MIKKNKLTLAAAGAALTLPLFALPAAAESLSCSSPDGSSASAGAPASCTAASITYMGLTFTNITIGATATGTGTVGLGLLTTFTNLAGEYGLQLAYTSNTGTNPNSSADVSLTYDVSGSNIDDALASFTGSGTGTGTASLTEVLTLGAGGTVDISLSGQGSTIVTFAPQSTLTALKDQDDFAGSSGSASSSVLVNAFSLATTPIPATLPLMATGLVGLWGFGRKRKANKNKVPVATA